MDDDELNLLLARTSAGAKHATLAEVVATLLDLSGRAFARGDDAAAKTLRDLGHSFKMRQAEAASQLDELNKKVAASRTSGDSTLLSSSQ